MTTEESAKAAAMVAGWYWQPAEAKNLRYQYAIRTFTRYYECAPVAADALKLILEYLRGQDVGSDGTLELLGKSVEGFSGYKAKEAWYQTTPSETWEGTKSQKIRIYQTFYHAAETSTGDGPYTVENGCQYTVTHTFHWNVETLPTLAASSSGVQYAMQGVVRDAETGLFSCVIECRTRVQQDVALYRQGGTVFETVQDEQHIGVKASEVDAAGQPASAGGGVIVTRRITKNPDCTSTVENTVTTETPVAGAAVEYRKTLRGSTTTTVNRNQSAALDGTGLAVGEVRRSEKTDGGLWNNSTTAKSADAAGVIAQSCQNETVEHTDTTVTNQATEPSSVEQTVEVNKQKQLIVRKTEEGSFDVEQRTTTFAPQTSGVKIWTDGNGRTYESLAYLNQTSPILPSGGSSSSASFHMNAHGSYDGGYQKVTTSGGSGGAAFHHTLIANKYEVTKVPGGKTKVRQWIVTYEIYGGNFEAVLQNVFGSSVTAAKDYPWIGCYSHVEGGGNNTVGYKYILARAGTESTLKDGMTL